MQKQIIIVAVRYKVVVQHEIDSNGQIVGVQYAVFSVNTDQDGDTFEKRETNWTGSEAMAQSQLATYRNHRLAARAG